MASPQVVLSLGAPPPPPSVLDSTIVVSKKSPIQIAHNKKPLLFYVNLAKRRFKEHHEVELSALGMAITNAVMVSEILKNSRFALMKKIVTSSVCLENNKLGRKIHKAKILIVLEKAEKANSLMSASDSKTKTDDHKDCTDGDNRVCTDGDHKDCTDGDHKDSTDGNKKEQEAEISLII